MELINSDYQKESGAKARQNASDIQINPYREQLGPEKADRGGVAGTASQLLSEPALAFARIVVGQHMCGARVPARPEPIAELQAYPRITRDVEDVAGFLAVLCHDPELFTHASVAHRSAAGLPTLAANRFQQRTTWRHQADSNQEFDRRVKQIFLKKVNNLMFHALVSMSRNCAARLNSNRELLTADR